MNSSDGPRPPTGDDPRRKNPDWVGDLGTDYAFETRMAQQDALLSGLSGLRDNPRGRRRASRMLVGLAIAIAVVSAVAVVAAILGLPTARPSAAPALAELAQRS
jgi:hypothetical protein